MSQFEFTQSSSWGIYDCRSHPFEQTYVLGSSLLISWWSKCEAKLCVYVCVCHCFFTASSHCLCSWVNFCFSDIIACVVITFRDNGTWNYLSCFDTLGQRDVTGLLFGCQRQHTACTWVCWRRTQAILLPLCVRKPHFSVCACANVRKERGLCLWGQCSSEVAALSHFFPLPLCILLNSRNVIWRCCSDPLLHLSTCARGALQFWVQRFLSAWFGQGPGLQGLTTRCVKQSVEKFDHRKASQESRSSTRLVRPGRGDTVLMIFFVCFCIWSRGNKDVWEWVERHTYSVCRLSALSTSIGAAVKHVIVRNSL